MLPSMIFLAIVAHRRYLHHDPLPYLFFPVVKISIPVRGFVAIVFRIIAIIKGTGGDNGNSNNSQQHQNQKQQQ
jgi:hypothetical protein